MSKPFKTILILCISLFFILVGIIILLATGLLYYNHARYTHAIPASASMPVAPHQEENQNPHLRSSVIYQSSWSALQSNPALVQRLGQPLQEPHALQGHIGEEEASLSFLVRGSKTSATVRIQAHTCEDSWVYSVREIQFEGDTEPIALETEIK